MLPYSGMLLYRRFQISGNKSVITQVSLYQLEAQICTAISQHFSSFVSKIEIIQKLRKHKPKQ